MTQKIMTNNNDSLYTNFFVFIVLRSININM